MADFLKGNFKTEKTVAPHEEKKETLESRFEKEALKRLGGSIAFVSKQKVVWDMEETVGEEKTSNGKPHGTPHGKPHDKTK